MAKVYNNIAELIGGTPLLRLQRINDGYAQILVKLESFNPGEALRIESAIQ